jgi:hypothetical protein
VTKRAVRFPQSALKNADRNKTMDSLLVGAHGYPVRYFSMAALLDTVLTLVMQINLSEVTGGTERPNV